MNPGDTIRVHMYDAAVPGGGGQRAFKVVIDDLTTGQSGFMQASAANGFADSNLGDCSGTPFNFQPEYNTAGSGNIVPWAALATDISTEFEIGHFIPCTSVTEPDTFLGDTYYNHCVGPYEDNSQAELGEPADALCFPQGDTHPAVGGSQPDIMTGCFDNWQQNGDLDYDGTPYYADWPTGAAPTAKLPGSFVESLPTSGGVSYPKYFVQTDAALSETTCSPTTTSGCTVPPQGPGGFYPYWSRVKDSKGVCTLEFGNVSSGPGVNDLGGDAQYGSDRVATLGYPEFEGAPSSNGSC
jgi:hypothetical protein